MDMNIDSPQAGIIANNFISLGGQQSLVYGLYIYRFDNTGILHNSINLYGEAGAFSTALLFDCQAGSTMLNNTFLNNVANNSLGGYSMIYSENALARGLFGNCNFNNLRTTGPWLAMLANNDLGTLASWRTATGFDVNSFSVDPEFITDTDLHTESLVLDNMGTPCIDVTTDIDGELRSLTAPDIGADEFNNEPADKTLALQIFLEGLYNGSNMMRQASDDYGPHFGAGIADQITVELHSAANYNTIVHLAHHVNLNTNGTVNITIPASISGSYYITIRHRNSITTTTAAPVSFSPEIINYSFDNPSKAYGGNLLQMITGQFVIYSGDVNQDGVVDTADMTPIDNDSANYAAGYLDTDVNGDGVIDTADMTIVDNNAAAYVGSITP
jgi:hypothetical protein